MTEPIPIEAPLSPAEDQSDPIRRGPRNRRTIPPCERPEAPDHFAPVSFVPICVDRVGYPRVKHEYDRDGRCYWCSRHRPGYEP